jgi:hypothetical protein
VRILEGVADLPTWDAETLQGVVDELWGLIPELRVAWGLAAGEGWCLVVFGAELVAAIRAPTGAGRATRFAFILARSPAAGDIQAVLRRAEAHTVELEDFEAEVLSIDPADFVAFAGSEPPHEEAFDPSGFAANDLVFITT